MTQTQTRYRRSSPAPRLHRRAWRSFFVVALFCLCHAVSVKRADAEVYLTVEQALDLVLGEQTEHVADTRPLDESVAEQLRSQGLTAEPKADDAHFYIGKKDGAVTGYALIDAEVGKHLPITYVVGLSPTGQVTQVEMMVFREVRGWEVREKRFMDQFRGKQSAAELEIGKGVQHVTGATLSSKAIAKGVRRAVFLWNHFYKKQG
ncbi:MAG: FMN-binding protein [Bdellovibrionota bacterium]